MDQLSPEAKAALKDEFERLSEDLNKTRADLNKTLAETNVWNWVARLLFVAFLGGSVFGFGRFIDFIDERIAVRSAAFDKIYLANAFSQSGQYRSALKEIAALLDPPNGTGSARASLQRFDEINLSRSQRHFFNLTVLDAVSQSDELDPSGRYIGAEFWKALLSSEFFKVDFTTGKQWESGDLLNQKLSSAYLRFSEDDDGLALALKHFEIATSQNSAREDYFQKMCMALILRRPDQARKYGLRYLDQYPNAPNIANVDWTHPTSLLLQNAARRVAKMDLKDELGPLAKQVHAERQKENIASRMARIRQVDPRFDPEAFITEAKQIFQAEFGKQYGKGSFEKMPAIEAIKNLLLWRSLNGFVDIELVELQSANITEVLSSDTKPNIVVTFLVNERLTFDSSDKKLNEIWERASIEKFRSVVRSRELRWTFERDYTTENRNWYVVASNAIDQVVDDGSQWANGRR